MPELTTSRYWDHNWKNSKKYALRPENDILHFYQTALFCRLFSRNPAIALIDVGCAPGRYLRFFSETFDYQLTGIDYSRSGVEETEKNLNRHGIRATIIHSDFLSFTFNRRFDIVFSAGFIEHFTDPRRIVQKMLDITVPGGKILATLPNFNGILGLSRKIFNPDIYSLHNPLSIDDLQRIFDFPAINHIEIDVLGDFIVPSPYPAGLASKAVSIISSAANRVLEPFYRQNKLKIRSPFLSPQFYVYAEIKE